VIVAIVALLVAAFSIASPRLPDNIRKRSSARY